MLWRLPRLAMIKPPPANEMMQAVAALTAARDTRAFGVRRRAVPRTDGLAKPCDANKKMRRACSDGLSLL